MTKIGVFFASCIIVSSSIGFTACENKAAKEAEAARIEQEKQEAINQALEKQKAELLREQQEQQELREQELKRQQEEKERLEKENKANSIDQFVGTYTFKSRKILGNIYYLIVEVLPDGRITQCTRVKGETYKKMFIGNINKISDHAFMIANAKTYILDDSYDSNRHIGSNYNRARDVVFDINENRTYINLDSYNNRDISEPDYYEFTRN